MTNYYSECTGIRDWHYVEINGYMPDLLVAKYIGEVVSTFKNRKNQRNIEGQPQIIIPRGLKAPRKTELKYFEGYLEGIHQDLIAADY